MDTKNIVMTILLSSLVLFPTLTFSQQKQKVTVARLKNGSAYIETSYIHEGGISPFSSSSNTYESPGSSIWVGPQTIQSLQAGLKKAKDWATKNETHQMEFEKEIMRFRCLDKDTYEFYQRYISSFSHEGKLTFFGFSDGTFKLVMEASSHNGFELSMDSKERIDQFLNILSGKSANKEIDDIFY